MNAVIFGLLYSRRAERDTESEDRKNIANILSSVFIKEREKCIFLYRMVMLIDGGRKISAEEKIERAFRYDSQDKENQDKNIEIFNSYVRGGIEVMYENFVNECRTKEDLLYRTYEFISNFQKESDGTLYDKEIEKLINGWK